MNSSRILAITRCFVFVLSALCSSTALPKNQELDEARRLLLKVATEREKLVAYRYELKFKIENQTDDSAARTFPDGLVVIVEHSQIDGHDLLLFDYSRCKKEFQQSTRWLARSGQYAYTGVEDQKASLFLRDRIPEKALRFLDIKGIGLGFLGDVKNGTKHTDLFWQMLQRPAEVKTRKGEDGLLEFERYRGSTILFDPEKGLWPTRSTTTHADCSIQVEMVQGEFVPIQFELLSFGARKDSPEDRLVATLEWTHVNQPFIVGRPQAKVLAERFRASYDEPSDSQLFLRAKK